MTNVRIEALAKTFRGQPVLRGIDLVVPDKGVLALLGPSGCGKTTLLRLIAGFDRADAGRIMLGDEIVDGAARVVPPERRRIGYVPQEGALFPHLTIAGNVAYGLPRGERKGPRGRKILDLVGLGQFADRYPYQLSGGQQQRAALARALAPGPTLVLLDEPFNALDLDLRRSMGEEVVALLRRAGTTAILVTHDPGEAFATADLVAVMQDGIIMQCASPDAVYRTPATPTVARLTGAAIFLEGTLYGGMVQTPLGALPLAGPPSNAAWIMAMLRPDQIILTGEADGSRAAIVDRSFRGDHTLLTVTGDGFRLGLRVQDHVEGEVVYLRVKGGCVAFPADGTI